ncbi:GpW/Gp25/anti-adapter protein IraD [Desulfitobacterium hafniense]|uniref:GpW/Gp25/anti-adapter protein IraD n=1 Tax=Desulfitobacterium hafniense TaxID=49338 RepID=A0A098AYX1_DESHA|nr:GpW/Gp25/anti-adapter protein IraD [Desulfitobacterium hafniense]
MQYDVRPLKVFDFGATGAQEVLQNVAFILSTMLDSCPMDRGFGWNPDLDSPTQAAKARNAARIIQAIQEQEPRATVEEIRFEGDALNGQLKPIVRVSIDESI